MRHFFSTRIKVVLVIAVLLALVLTVVVSLTGKNYPAIAMQTVLTPLRAGANALTNQIERVYDYVFGYEALEAENAALKEQIAKLEAESRDSDSLAREIERYRALLELLETNQDYELVDGYIISRSSNDWTSTLTINCGTSSGVETGMCAITANGEVVGIVTEAGRNYCVVKTVLDSSLEISATIAATGHSGMISGGYTYGHSDMLWMKYLDSTAILRNNDQVVTSGSTVYPRNLILGYVVDAGFDDTGVAKYAVLKPAADIDSLEQIFILTAFDKE